MIELLQMSLLTVLQMLSVGIFPVFVFPEEES